MVRRLKVRMRLALSSSRQDKLCIQEDTMLLRTMFLFSKFRCFGVGGVIV
jgi:hypothetical protein